MIVARRSLLLAITAVLAGAGCDRLETSPGRDFEVTVLSPSPIPAIGKITVPVRFAVAGCDSFDVDVATGGERHAVAARKESDGSYLAAVPVEWLRVKGRFCTDDALAPRRGSWQLLVTCRDVGRTAAADVALAYGTATRVHYYASGLPRVTAQYLAPNTDPLTPWTVLSSALEPAAVLEPHSGSLGPALSFWLGTAFLEAGLARPRLVTSESTLYLSSGCYPGDTCPPVALSPSGSLASEMLNSLAIAAGSPIWEGYRRIWVPAHVVDMAFAASGALIVLSEQYDTQANAGVSVLSRVVPTREGGAADVQVIGHYPGERAATRFSRTPDGRLAFVSWAWPFRWVIHTTDGQTIADRADPTAGFDAATIQLAPDAGSLVIDGRYLGSADTTFRELPVTDVFGGIQDTWGAVWLDHAVALWRGSSITWGVTFPGETGAVEVFDAAPPHAQVFRHEVGPLNGDGGLVHLFGATPIGDKLVLTTSTGVRILGRDGALVGGADPLPCDAPTSLAVQVGSTTVAVGAGPYVYVFDLADLSPAGG